jgi:signal transduction histidine kinase
MVVVNQNGAIVLLNVPVIIDILDFSKNEAGKTELESIDFNLRDCVEEALKVLASYADENGLQLTSDFAPGGLNPKTEARR